MISFRQKGDFKNLTKFLERSLESIQLGVLDKYGKEGVAALASSTPIDSGLTASSWYYKIENDKRGAKLSFHNSNIVDNVPIAIVIQYGHATGTGGWVEGRDYINPSLQPIFDKIADTAWKEVNKK